MTALRLLHFGERVVLGPACAHPDEPTDTTRRMVSKIPRHPAHSLKRRQITTNHTDSALKKNGNPAENALKNRKSFSQFSLFVGGALRSVSRSLRVRRRPRRTAGHSPRGAAPPRRRHARPAAADRACGNATGTEVPGGQSDHPTVPGCFCLQLSVCARTPRPVY